jgi:hypothetical protein
VSYPPQPPQPPQPQPPQPQWYYGAPPPRRSGISGGAIFVIFLAVLLVLTLVGTVVILLSLPSPPIAPCEPGRVCAPQPSLPPFPQRSLAPTRTATPAPTPNGSALPSPVTTPGPDETPTSNSPVLISGEVWRSGTLGYFFEYDPDAFSISQASDELAIFDVSFAHAQVVIVGASGDVSPSELIQSELTGNIDRIIIGRTLDRDPYDALLGPSIGHVRGEGAVYAGTLLGSDGTPVAPAGVTIVAASDGRITVAVVVIVGQPDVLDGSDTVQYQVRQAADQIVKTFDWDGTP